MPHSDKSTANSTATSTAAGLSLNRRYWLATGAAGLAATGAWAATGKSPAAPLVLTAQATEGPYYFDAVKVRADITEGLQGVPLEVRFVVMDRTGTALSGARVDIWHCNAAGLYSGYAGQGENRSTSTQGSTFLRGTLTAGTDGVAAFRTVYPGWYEGRTTHIHFKVFTGGRAVLTSQFFLPDALSEFLYTSLPDYRRTQLRQTLNRNDGIALMAGSTVLGSVREEADRYVATLDVVVDPLARPVAGRPPMPGAGPGLAGGEPPGPPPGAGHGPRLDAAARLSALIPGRPRS